MACIECPWVYPNHVYPHLLNLLPSPRFFGESDGLNSWQVPIQKIVIFEFLFVARTKGRLYLGPAPNPGIFEGIGSENHFAWLGLWSNLGARSNGSRLCGDTTLKGITVPMGSHRERFEPQLKTLILFANIGLI